MTAEYLEQTVNSGISWTQSTGISAPATYEFRFTRVGRVVTCTLKFTATGATTCSAGTGGLNGAVSVTYKL